MVIKAGNAPFAGATLVIFMEARDTPWTWAFGRLRGRSDLLIIRGVLRQTPGLECEVLEIGSWSAREAQPRVPREWISESDGPFVICARDGESRAFAKGLLGRAKTAGLGIKRLAVRRGEPHFQIHVRLPGPGKSADGFFAAVRELAVRVVA
jgi:hypothetical protein